MNLEARWRHEGLDCVVIQYDSDLPVVMAFEIAPSLQPWWRCGYVRIPKRHPWTTGVRRVVGPELGLPAIEAWEHPGVDALDIHGGATYYRPYPPAPELGLPRGWWIGYDTQHHRDSIERWPLEAVKAETERLAEAVIAAAVNAR